MLQSTFDIALAAYREWIGMSTTPVAARRGRGRPARMQRIIAASDFHIPFHSKYALQELLKEAQDTSLLVIPGDFLDHWSWSRWPKSRKESEPVEEFKEGQVVLSLLAEKFRQIVIFGGNHCSRPRKYLADRLPPEIMAYLEMTAPGSLSPLKLMASQFSNVEIAEPAVKDNAEFPFIWQLGDCVFSHAEKYSQIPNRAVSGPVLQWLMSFARPQGIVSDFRCVVQGHTHQAGTVIGDFNVLAIENGCMCPVQSYQGDAKIMSRRPPQLGWSVIRQDNGRTDIRESRFIPLEVVQ